ncbi:MAG: AmmeMemoRadiSam system protein B [Desulfobacterales bacterium]|nr:AmmeMemoRadiSam system protein B [Desulfobacterales bacterium]
MGTHLFRTFILAHLVIFALSLFPAYAAGEQSALKDVRPSVLAGTWYPGSQDALAKSIAGYLSRVKPPHIDGQLKAIIVPHAAHMYSGQVAAHAYRLLEGSQFRRIILVGPSHRVGFEGVSVNLQSGYKTPLGVVPIDQEMAKRILDSGPHIRWLRQAHAHEHCLEIQLPFLQTVLHNFQIIPILMGQQDYNTCSRLANTLVQVMGSAQDTLILASSDLSHFYPYDQARELDLEFIKRIKGFDPEGLAKDLSAGKCKACGGGPVITTMLAARKLGADRAVVLNYANSGDVTGDHSSVVGYMAAALYCARP